MQDNLIEVDDSDDIEEGDLNTEGQVVIKGPKALTKKRLIRLVAKDSGYLIYEVEDVLESFLRIFEEAVYRGKKVQFNKFMTVSAPHNKVRPYWDAKSNSTKMSKGVRKLRCTASPVFMEKILKLDVREDTVDNPTEET